jgi:hypothetical protein
MRVVSGSKSRVSVEFTRPSNTTPYTAGDVVSNSTSATTMMEFTNAVRKGGSGLVVGAIIATDEPSVTARYRLHLYRESTVTLAADNAPFIDLYADQGKKLGSFDFAAMTTPANATGDAVSRSQNFALAVPVRAVGESSSLFGVLEVLDGPTPVSGQKFQVTLYTEMDW